LVHGERWIDHGSQNNNNNDNGENSSSLDSNDDNRCHSNNPKDERKTPKTIIIATVGVDQYRATIDQAVRPGDIVLEVGCHLGTTTQLLQQRASAMTTTTTIRQRPGYAIGADVSAKIIERAQQRYRDVRFVVGDAWKTGRLLQLLQHGDRPNNNGKDDGNGGGDDRSCCGFDVVYVDVGGLSGRDGLLDALILIHQLQNALEPRIVCIKSLCMQQLALRLIPYWRFNKKQQQKH
jgi:SAM-dependent methyltransferase